MMQDLTKNLSILLQKASKFVNRDVEQPDFSSFGKTPVLSPIKPNGGKKVAAAAEWIQWGESEMTPGIRWTKAGLIRYQHEVTRMIREIVCLLDELYVDTQQKIKEQR